MDIFSTTWFLVLVVVLALWDLILKLIALWQAARNGQKVWFICLGLLNTIGILPIVYILMHRKKEGTRSV